MKFVGYFFNIVVVIDTVGDYALLLSEMNTGTKAPFSETLAMHLLCCNIND